MTPLSGCSDYFVVVDLFADIQLFSWVLCLYVFSGLCLIGAVNKECVLVLPSEGSGLMPGPLDLLQSYAPTPRQWQAVFLLISALTLEIVDSSRHSLKI